MKRLLVFGGTAEGRELAAKLADLGFAVTVCVATDYGGGLMRGYGNIKLRVGRLAEPEMSAFIAQGAFEAVIDATHPYAAEASANIGRAAEENGVACLRLVRPPAADGGGDVIYAASAEEAAGLLEGLPGNILLTTGSKDLEAFARLADYRERVWVRVLPRPESLEKCLALGFPPAHVICMQGPFSRELNAAILRQYDIKIMATKDAGAEGGFPEKAAAAAEAGAKLLLIRRPVHEEGLSLGDMLELFRREASK